MFTDNESDGEFSTAVHVYQELIIRKYYTDEEVETHVLHHQIVNREKTPPTKNEINKRTIFGTLFYTTYAELNNASSWH